MKLIRMEIIFHVKLIDNRFLLNSTGNYIFFMLFLAFAALFVKQALCVEAYIPSTYVSFKA